MEQSNQNQKQIAYYRVSTQKQGKSGLGLDAQKYLVKGFLGREPDEEFIEIESGTGKGVNRIELRRAIGRALKLNARLVIAKLDRLSRNVHFISGLMETKVDFVCCDNPTATPFTLHILAAVAEHEAKVISERTKAALAEKKKRGFKLGAPEGRSGFSMTRIPKEGSLSAREIIEKRDKVRRDIRGFSPAENLIVELMKKSESINSIRSVLNESGFKASMGGIWSNTQICRVIKRFEEWNKDKEIESENIC